MHLLRPLPNLPPGCLAKSVRVLLRRWMLLLQIVGRTKGAKHRLVLSGKPLSFRVPRNGLRTFGVCGKLMVADRKVRWSVSTRVTLRLLRRSCDCEFVQSRAVKMARGRATLRRCWACKRSELGQSLFLAVAGIKTKKIIYLTNDSCRVHLLWNTSITHRLTYHGSAVDDMSCALYTARLRSEFTARLARNASMYL